MRRIAAGFLMIGCSGLIAHVHSAVSVHTATTNWIYIGMAVFSGILLIAAAGLHTYRVNSKLHNMVRLMRSADVQQRNHNLVLAQIAADDPLDEILTSLVQGVEHIRPDLKCSILRIDVDQQHFVVAAAPSLPEFYNDAINGLAIDATLGAFGEAAITAKRVVAIDIQSNPNWSGLRELAAHAELASCWAEPILSHNRSLLGVFVIYKTQRSEPDNDEIKLIEESAYLAEIAIERKLSLEALRKSEELHRIMAQHDSLTGLPNRALFADRLQQALSYCKRHQRVLAVMLLDLDKFKPVNDHYGHAIGDELLKQVAQRLLACVRSSDTVARIGGDEFVILLHQIDDMSQANIVSEKILHVLNREFLIGTQDIHIGCSIGAAFYPQDAQEAHELTQIADQRMYLNKGLSSPRVAQPL
ncbi:MAG: hypothetical protein B0W54_17450 [Cellvibrio sp. 79]|nr:MAG: hypothetical protein B0W54_17450 [Cellvibrio sp. 79]